MISVNRKDLLIKKSCKVFRLCSNGYINDYKFIF